MKIAIFGRDREAIRLHKKDVKAASFIYDERSPDIVVSLGGDGAVVSTPFGSTAYYYSITKKIFKSGIGIAFNNLAKKADHKITPEDSTVEIKLTRGDATFSWDNNEEIVAMRTGESVKVRMSDKVARVVRMK